MTTVSPDPFILTLDFDAAATEWFNKLRTAHFPPDRNWLTAHLTLFHHLPPGNEQVRTDLEGLARQTAQLSLNASGLIHLGGGVAYRIENAELSRLHHNLQQRWLPWLTAQDRQKRTFHITVQNKVSPGVAGALLRDLSGGFEPFAFSGTGFTLWTYKNGPWEFYRNFPFLKD